jgi:hypothetical protein
VPQEGLAPGLPAPEGVHVPGVASHRSQPSLHAVLQHRPSAQRPLAHVVEPPPHDWPLLSLQDPPASQVFVPVHVSWSSAPFTELHVPGVAAHV